ncbi:MAG: Eco57I restriction-modification methylase domain-containing protein, partial [Porphyromonadaceae bacterium]|nr:Eco57I restriction-modification methylase domain-containing protein [Porphyromonadaceae bacterium]
GIYWKKKDIINMNFKAVVGNPPYQIMGGSGGNNDAPIFQYFCDIASLISDNYISMIIPARWYTTGRDNLLGPFRERFLTSRSIKSLFTYTDSSKLFSTVSIKGGLCYFLEDKDYSGDCDHTFIDGEKISKGSIDLNEFDILIRDPKISDIVSTVKSNSKDYQCLGDIISNDTPFGIPSNPKSSSKNPFKVYSTSSVEHDILLYHIEKQKRKIEYVRREDVTKNRGAIDNIKVFIPGSGGSGNDTKVLGKEEIAPKGSVCSQSYLYAKFDNLQEAENFAKYIRTKFVRILIAALKITQQASNKVYRFVPMQDFSNNSIIDWKQSVPQLDEQLFKMYKFSCSQISFIKNALDYY